jgi:hypothetical protein
VVDLAELAVLDLAAPCMLLFGTHESLCPALAALHCAMVSYNLRGGGAGKHKYGGNSKNDRTHGRFLVIVSPAFQPVQSTRVPGAPFRNLHFAWANAQGRGFPLDALSVVFFYAKKTMLVIRCESRMTNAAADELVRQLRAVEDLRPSAPTALEGHRLTTAFLKVESRPHAPNRDAGSRFVSWNNSFRLGLNPRFRVECVEFVDACR